MSASVWLNQRRTSASYSLHKASKSGTGACGGDANAECILVAIGTSLYGVVVVRGTAGAEPTAVLRTFKNERDLAASP